MIFHKKGSFIVERNSKLYEFEGSVIKVKDLQQSTNQYTLQEISEALTLLINNSHVEIRWHPEKEFSEVSISSNGGSVTAYHDNFYKIEIEERKKDWPARNWFFADAIKIITSGILGGLIATLLTLQCNHQSKTKPATERSAISDTSKHG